ncbi:hypothetical protein [Persicobacter sp. CCB-QB2]|uniref:hypothetical protein n=1 Tax=Persicobacter sp. CCB-QB2 TaxID=1561025 RepID=UPI0006A9A9F7|nr:hypothetical protein [Persicobacter sp. CCB-QB2]
MIREKKTNRKELEELLNKDEEPLVQELKSLGLGIDSVWDLVNNSPHQFLERDFTGDYSIAYETLVKHLDYHPKTIEGIIRALTEKEAKKIATDKILELFQKETDKNLQWVMANALRTLMTWSKRQKYPEIGEILKGI